MMETERRRIERERDEGQRGGGERERDNLFLSVML